MPPVSVLKPVRGLDPNTLQAFRSQVRQDYPQFEILFAVRDPNDPAAATVEKLIAEFPDVAIRLIRTTAVAPNGKVASLIDLSREARHPVWVVNDGDIAVTPSYLRDVVAPLAQGDIGVVTCPYYADAHSAATRWEALGIASDFFPSTTVAQLIGVRDFGLGSTLAFRAADLATAGGFEAFADYLADDFQLAHRITLGGKRALLSRHVVQTSLGEGDWRGMWWHQVRWARTVRRCKGAGYAGLPICHAGLWALIALVCGSWQAGCAIVVLRLISGLLPILVLRARQAFALAWLTPLWDLFAFAVWVAAWCGNTVRWRDRKLRITADGRIQN